MTGDDGGRTMLYNTHLIWMSRQRILEFCYFFYLSLSNLFSFSYLRVNPCPPCRSIIVNIYDTFIRQKWHRNLCVFFSAKKIGYNIRSSNPCSNFPTKIRIYILARLLLFTMIHLNTHPIVWTENEVRENEPSNSLH